MRLFSKKFYHHVGENMIGQPVVLCPRCLILLEPRKYAKDDLTMLCYKHRHKPLWIYLIQKSDGWKKYRIPLKRISVKRNAHLRDMLHFAGMGWMFLGWSVLQVAYYIKICLDARRNGEDIDAIALLFMDFKEPGENEKAEILRALGLEGPEPQRSA